MSQSHHPSAHELGRFVEGDLTDDVAVSVALHLDDCPACATHVASLDPLSTAFASVDDPPVPGVLLGLGTALLFLAGGPTQTLAGMGTTFRALLTVVEVLASEGGATLLVTWAATAAMVLAAAVVTARSIDLRRDA